MMAGCKPLAEICRDDLLFYKVLSRSPDGAALSWRNFRGCNSRPGFVFAHEGFNRFASVETAVPAGGALVETPSAAWLREYVFDASKHRIVADASRLPAAEEAVRIVDNGGMPFVAYLSTARVAVFRRARDGYVDERDWSNDFERDRLFYGEPVVEIAEPLATFVGRDGSAADARGNSLLIRVDESVYVYIGAEIYSFRSHEPVEAYYSRMGNSDVNYPLALTASTVLFLLERQRSPRDQLAPHLGDPVAWDEAYRVFYSAAGLPKEPLQGLKCIAPREE